MSALQGAVLCGTGYLGHAFVLCLKRLMVLCMLELHSSPFRNIRHSSEKEEDDDKLKGMTAKLREILEDSEVPNAYRAVCTALFWGIPDGGETGEAGRNVGNRGFAGSRLVCPPVSPDFVLQTLMNRVWRTVKGAYASVGVMAESLVCVQRASEVVS